jgi:ATP-binding cassette subfamily B protein
MPRQTSNGGRDTRRPSGPAAFTSSAIAGKSLKERLGALENLRPFLQMVWGTSRGLTGASLALRVAVPVSSLFRTL